MIESYVKTVVYRNSYFLSYTKYECLNEMNSKTICEVETYFQQLFPYIIFSISQTYIVTQFEKSIQNNKKKFSDEQIIGIVCGVTAVFFSILGIVILIIQKKNSLKYDSDLEIDSDSENEAENEENQQNIKNQTVNYIQKGEIENNIDDNWL